MAKDKKKDKRADKKSAKKTKVSAANPAKAATRKIKDWSQNPLVADVVAAALVATASALKDSRKAQRLAEDAGEEIERLTKKSARRGSELWQMALEIGRRSLEELSDSGSPGRGKSGRK